MRSYPLLIAVAICIVAGCKPPTEYAVTGRVTLDGEPLPEATISFIPTDESLSTVVTRTDEEGMYIAEIDSDRFGLEPGNYTVRISTFDEGDAEADPPLPSRRELVPEKYNLDSELSAEVKPEMNVIDFPLKRK